VANAPALNVSAPPSVVKNMFSISTLHSTQ
jgi:hypothetical protein